jgi:drug/metabolite transporter (DMT)-like permease
MNQVRYRDERESTIDRAGDRLAYLVLSYGLLLIVAYQSLVERRAAWDLLGLVVLGGVVGFAYRFWHRALTRNSAVLVGVTILVAVVVGVVVALALRA